MFVVSWFQSHFIISQKFREWGTALFDRGLLVARAVRQHGDLNGFGYDIVVRVQEIVPVGS